MKNGKPPIGTDGKPVELHHDGQTQTSPLLEMTREAHRGKGNFTKNHTNTGQKPSKVNHSKFATQRQQHWKRQHKDQTQQ
jgi:hypothetical protein